MNFEPDKSRKNDESTRKRELPASIESEIFANTERSIESTSRGIVMDLKADQWNASDSMRFSRESRLNEIHERESQC
jgi:hypothetical protein